MEIAGGQVQWTDFALSGPPRVVVDIQPDGDLMFDAGALWMAAKYEIPMLIVMHNNRAYYNDWEHQIRIGILCLVATHRAPASNWSVARSTLK